MDSTRQQTVARLLQKDLGEILQGMPREVSLGAMLTVTVVRVSPDLSTARVYVSVFPSEKGSQVLENLQKAVGRIRMQCGQRVRHQLRIVPALTFFIDDSLDYADRIESLLSE